MSNRYPSRPRWPALSLAYPIVLTALHLATCPAVAQVIADSRADWDRALNPVTGPPQGHADTHGSGSWYYENSFLVGGGGRRQALAWDSVTGSFGPYKIHRSVMSPGASYRGAWASTIRKWKSGVTARVRLTGRFRQRDSRSDGMDFWIHGGGGELYHLFIPAGDVAPHDFEFQFWVGVGQSITVIAGPYRSNHYDGADAWWTIERSPQPLVGLRLNNQQPACVEYSSEPRLGTLRRGITETLTVLGGQGPFAIGVSSGIGPHVVIPGYAFGLDLDLTAFTIFRFGTLTQPGNSGCNKYSQRVSIPVPTQIPAALSVAFQALASTSNAPANTPGFSRPLLTVTQ